MHLHGVMHGLGVVGLRACASPPQPHAIPVHPEPVVWRYATKRVGVVSALRWFRDDKYPTNTYHLQLEELVVQPGIGEYRLL